MELPDNFRSRTKALLGHESAEFFESLEKSPPVSIRLNPAKLNLIPQFEKVLWTENGYYLKERPLFTADPWLHAGAYYVQEASSMVLEEIWKQAVEPKTPSIVLDACAAPGGKSTHLLNLMKGVGLLIANETIKARSSILRENCIKWGFPNGIVSSNDTSIFQEMKEMFDVVLVDAPCSGEGMFRKDLKALKNWSEENISLCASRQKKILANLVDSIRDEGILIYSTCTFNREENEDNLDWLLQNFDFEPVRLKLKSNIVEGLSKEKAYTYRFFPHRVKGEGLCISVLRKNGKGRTKKIKSNLQKQSGKLPPELRHWLRKPEKFEQVNFEGEELIFPSNCKENFLFFIDKLNVRYAGLIPGRKIKNDLIPSHALALSTILDSDSCHINNLNYDDSIRYLKKENLSITDSKTGFILTAYNGINQGWIKNIGNRVNNLFPKEWRIRLTEERLKETETLRHLNKSTRI